jgi:signal transduction histidine kinase
MNLSNINPTYFVVAVIVIAAVAAIAVIYVRNKRISRAHLRERFWA